ncbi:alpha-E domain-containing protein [Gorillibacterium timonense]|uniref:alpha-E domain-containing protein n=1 Tax=Gorillibacterium timonense TaxID=1689269 RepID=UPI00071DA284|nr:alpha-E domain-containing protein [Gorillibacterium timonense]
MMSRNAEALFWIGRYVERAENHARLIDVHYHIQTEGEFQEEGRKWVRLLSSLGVQDAYAARYESLTEAGVLEFITLDRDHAHSISSCVHQARGNLRQLRQKLPSELWDALNGFDLWLGEQTIADIMAGPHQFFRQVKDWSAIFLGTEESVMLREEEWRLIKCGRFLERAENTVRILRSLDGVLEGIREEDSRSAYPVLQGILKSVSGYQAFRRYYADEMRVPAIFAFLMTQNAFPRSVRYSFHRLEDHLTRLVQEAPIKGCGQEKAIRYAGKIRAELDFLEEEPLENGRYGELLDFLGNACLRLGKMMEEGFFGVEGAVG